MGAIEGVRTPSRVAQLVASRTDHVLLVVELMRQGKTPTDAAIGTLERIAQKTAPRLLSDRGRPNFNLRFYCVNKAGEYAGASMYGDVRGSTPRFAVDDGEGSRLQECVALFDALPA